MEDLIGELIFAREQKYLFSTSHHPTVSVLVLVMIAMAAERLPWPWQLCGFSQELWIQGLFKTAKCRM